jgi:hemerythrin-like metal-binding protein
MAWQSVVFDPSKMASASVDVSSELVAHWLANGELPPALVTGHKLIDFEHCFLLSIIADLRRVCSNYTGQSDCGTCSDDLQGQCESLVVGMLGDLFAFILDHFKTEEAVMRESLLLMVDRNICEAHMEDHAAISSKVQEIVSSLDSRHVVSRIRELDALLTRWLVNHIALHDQILMRWISRDDSMHKHL